MNSLRTLGVIVTLAATIAGCGGSDDPSGPNGNSDREVNATPGDAFVPNVIDIQQGQSVTWVFGAVDHDVTFAATPGAPANIGLTRNTSVSRSFGTVGNFSYTCSVHDNMDGMVRVTAVSSGPGY